jgi:hypothetical protein
MHTPDPMAQRFMAGKQLAPWQKTANRFDFDEGFVEHIRKYLGKLNAVSDAAAAKSWINKGFFNLERQDLVYLQWQEYESKKLKQCPAPSNRVASDADVGTNQPDISDPDPIEEFTGEKQRENIRKLRELIENKGKVKDDRAP